MGLGTRCFDLEDLPQVANADYLYIQRADGNWERWGKFKGCWANNVTLTSYNYSEFLLYNNADTAEEYVEEFDLDMNCPIENLEAEDRIIREFLEGKEHLIWELMVDYEGSYSDSYYYSNKDVQTMDDVYDILWEGLDILCHDFQRYHLGIDELDTCAHDLASVKNNEHSSGLYECYFSKKDLEERIQSRIDELKKLIE